MTLMTDNQHYTADVANLASIMLPFQSEHNLHIFLRDATIELIDTINSFKNIKWFFIEGTLLSVLRYGSTFEKLEIELI